MKILSILSLLIIVHFSFSQNTPVTNTILFEGEPSLVVNPINSQQLTAAWMSVQLGQNVVIKTSVSNDGGTTWSTATSIAHEVVGNTSADPSLQYDANGDLFLCYVDYNSTTFANGQVIVRKSTDNGISWGTSVEVISIADCPDKLCIDRPWMVVDKTSGVNAGTIYVTTMNADQSGIVIPPYNPYLSISTDGGNSFANPRFLDTVNYLAGSIIIQPMPSPTIGADGTFYAVYPSFETTQSPLPKYYLAESTDAGNSLNISTAYTVLISVASSTLAKKAHLLIADPSDADHLALFLVADPNGNGGDVLFSETYDGTTWTALGRINQDPTGNGRMQDLVWADFSQTGDLAVCWRDRRNASSTGYQTETEIFGVIRYADSTNFEQDFAISSQQINHEAILEGSGNDFMSVKFGGDTLYTIWGDVRTGTLNLFINRLNISTGTSSMSTISHEKSPLKLYPNPTSDYLIIDQFEQFTDLRLIDQKGNHIQTISNSTVDISALPTGNYFVHFSLHGKQFISPFVKATD